MAGSESEGLNMEQSRERFANEVDVALAQSARPFAIHNARKVDARGVAEHYWIVSDGSAIIATGNRDDDFLRLAQASVWMPILIPIRSVRLVPSPTLQVA